MTVTDKHKIGIIGSRSRNTDSDFDQIENTFLILCVELNINPSETIIVSGGCPMGGDRFAEILIKKYNTGKKIYPAQWDDLTSLGPNNEKPVIRMNKYGKKYNKSAGYWRNSDIARESDYLICCVSESRKGGTEDTIKKAEELNKKIIIVQ